MRLHLPALPGQPFTPPIAIGPRPPVRRLPTARPFPYIDTDDQPTRRRLYALTKERPITAQTGAIRTESTLEDTIDHLRVLEEWRIIRHTADDLGVIYWRPIANNVWEQPGPPF